MEDVIRELMPAFTALVMTVVTGLLTWVSVWLKARFQIEIEARHREALHSALETGVTRVLDKLATLPQVREADAAIREVVVYAQGSVPDAIKALAPSTAQLRNMAVAKAKEALLRAAEGDWRAPRAQL